MGAEISSLFCRSGRGIHDQSDATSEMFDVESQSSCKHTTTHTDHHEDEGLEGIQSILKDKSLGDDDTIPLSSYKCNCYHHDVDTTPILSTEELDRHIGTDITPPQKLTVTIIPTLCNTIILSNDDKQAIVIDPGAYEDEIMKKITELQVNVTQILITHAHFDHALAATRLQKLLDGVPKIHLHRADRVMWQFIPLQLSMMKLQLPPDFELGQPDVYIEEGGAVDLGGVVIHTPGHTEGSVSFYFPKARLLCSGDTLFRQNVGRCDLMGGNMDSLKSSIIHKLYVLPDSTRVYPGHGPMTVIGYEKWNNNVVKLSL